MDDKLGEDFAAAIGDKRVCLMRGHGITSVGASIEEATVTAIRLNEAAEMNYRANLLGIPLKISEEDMRVFRTKKKKKDRAPKPPHLNATWRYYVELTGA